MRILLGLWYLVFHGGVSSAIAWLGHAPGIWPIYFSVVVVAISTRQAVLWNFRRIDIGLIDCLRLHGWSLIMASLLGVSRWADLPERQISFRVDCLPFVCRTAVRMVAETDSYTSCHSYCNTQETRSFIYQSGDLRLYSNYSSVSKDILANPAVVSCWLAFTNPRLTWFYILQLLTYPNLSLPS